MVRIALPLVFIMMFVGTIACDCHGILHLDKTDQPDQSDQSDQSDQPDKPCVLDVITNTVLAFLVGGAALKGLFNYIGFSSSGPVAGSIAAGLQSGTGSVASGSKFAKAQSLGMTTVAGLSAPIAIGAVIVGGAYLIYERVQFFSESDN